MNENIELKNKEIITAAMRKNEKKGKSIIVPDAVFNKTNSSNIKEDNKIKEKTLSEKAALLETENEKLKKKVEQLEEKIEELKEEIKLDEKYYGYK